MAFVSALIDESRYGATVTVRHNVKLSDYTTLGVGGSAKEFVQVSSRQELIGAVVNADETSKDVLILGGGSNVVISDDGFSGRVIHIDTQGISFAERDGSVRVSVEAGVDWNELVDRCVHEGLSGIESMSGIPGSLGGAVVQNIGAYGTEISSVIHSVEVFDREQRSVESFDVEACGFEYRNSVFKRQSRYVVLGATLQLVRSELSVPIAYAELARHLDVELGEQADLNSVRSTVRQLRSGKGMLIDPSDPDSRSAGSFFTNPIIEMSKFDELCLRTSTQPPAWPVGDCMKVSAAWLINQAGFHKGLRRGNAALSSKHSLALVNTGSATTSELLSLGREIRNQVSELFDITLEAEPVMIGVTL